jgi:hypothetical protein
VSHGPYTTQRAFRLTSVNDAAGRRTAELLPAALKGNNPQVQDARKALVNVAALLRKAALVVAILAPIVAAAVAGGGKRKSKVGGGLSAECQVDDSNGANGPYPGPYADLENTDNPDIAVTAPNMFDPRQKVKILNANEMRNGGLRSDDPADPAPVLVRPISVNPRQFPKPSKSRDANGFLNEAQVDHIKPFVDGGSNSYCNARVISQELNIRKRHGKA